MRHGLAKLKHSARSALAAAFPLPSLAQRAHAYRVGGNRVRIRLSNEMGSTPLSIGGVHIAVRAAGAAIQPGTDRLLTFSGNNSITVPPGAPVLSDPVDLPVAPLSDLAVSIYLPGTAGATTIHGTASQTNYVSA